MKRILIERGSQCRMNRWIFTPESGDFSQLPLIIFLHGAGERGAAADHVFRHGIPKLIREGRNYPAIILCPQCPDYLVWDNAVEELRAMIDAVISEYAIKADRVALTGASMGGFGAWALAMTYPTFFSAVAPVAGGGMSWRTVNLISTPVFAYHGTEDESVPIIYSKMMTDGVNANGGTAILTPLAGFGHNDGIDEAYRNTDLVNKLLTARRTDFSPVPECCAQYF